jgi:hypothetical protein
VSLVRKDDVDNFIGSVMKDYYLKEREQGY